MTDAPRRVTRVSAYAVCLDAQRRLLLCRIAPGWTATHDGWWTLPGGGLEHGEDPRDAALRELTEETGLVGEIVELLDVDSGRSDFTDRDGVATDYHGIRILYRVRVTGGELRDEPDGSTDAAAWVDDHELASLPVVDLALRAVDLTQRRPAS